VLISLLKIENIKTQYFSEDLGLVKAVDGVSIDISENEIVGIVGESGCGKTTLGFSIMRMVPKPGRTVEGRILLRGRDILSLSEKQFRNLRGKEISMIFQDPFSYLNPTMKISDQITDVIMLHQKKTKKDAIKMAEEIFEDVRLPSPRDILNSFPHELSGGMLQRILISIAISCHPSLIIADEPTTALDVTVQRQILELLKNLGEEHKISILLITHDLGIVAEICDKVYVMYAGQVVETSDVFSLYDSPQHPYTQALLASVLSINKLKDELIAIRGEVPDMRNYPRGCRFHPRCPYVMDICSEKDPFMIERRGRAVRCWLYEQDVASR